MLDTGDLDGLVIDFWVMSACKKWDEAAPHYALHACPASGQGGCRIVPKKLVPSSVSYARASPLRSAQAGWA